MWLSLYILALAALALHAPDTLWQAQVRDFVIVLAVLGAWQYGWGAVHLARGLWYGHVVFPRWRRAADQSGAAGTASHVYIVIATSRVRGETTARVYQAAIAEAIRYARPATIVAGVGELADQRWVKRAFLQMNPPPEIRLAFVRRPAIGKRQLMACSLRAGVPYASVPRCRRCLAGRRRPADRRQPGAESAFSPTDARRGRHHH
jgi:mannuronan synthase